MFDIDKELRQIKCEAERPSEQLMQKTRQLVMEEVRRKQQTKHLGRLTWVLTSVIAVFTAFIILLSLPPAADGGSYYTVDINPSVSMKVDASQRVLEVSAENDDAVMLLKTVKLEGLSFEEALSEFVSAADDAGYLKDQGHVLVAHFGDASGVTEQEVENAVNRATQRKVTALLLQSTKADFEQTKTQHKQPGIELLKKQATDQGIKERDVDEIIEQIRGNSAKQQNGSQNSSGKADNQPPAASAQNDQSEKNNGGGSGNKEKVNNHEKPSSDNSGGSKNDKKEDSGSVSDKTEDKQGDGNNANQSGSGHNKDVVYKDENTDNDAKQDKKADKQDSAKQDKHSDSKQDRQDNDKKK